MAARATRGRWARLGVMTMCLGAAPAWAAEREAPLEASTDPALSASLSVLNRYVSRGFQYSGPGGVVQPALGLEWRGLSAGLWANLDLEQRATQSFVPERLDEASLNEVDVTLGYAHALGPVTVGMGWAYYATRAIEHTQELTASLALDVPLQPTLTVYRDVDAFPATYVSASLAHEVGLPLGLALQLGASAGFLAGDSEAWRTAPVGGEGPGALYRAFHDGSVRVALDVPLGDVTLQPSLQYVFPLSADARREAFNPAGHLERVWVFGVSAGVSR
jgi:hypothetical protein